MKIGNWKATESLGKNYIRLREMGLESNVAELEAFGFTVIESVLSIETVDTLRESILNTTAERTGIKPDVVNGKSNLGMSVQMGLLGTHPLVEEVLMTPQTIALIKYLLGDSCLVSSLASHVKGDGGAISLHSDVAGGGTPQPYPMYSLVANCNYALCDYTKQSGAFAVVPGSHRKCRTPDSHEAVFDDYCIPVEVPAGSAIVWHGNTWHGSYPRTVPGFRVNFSTYFCRPGMQTQEVFRDSVPQEIYDRNTEEFARLMGNEQAYGFGPEGIDYEKLGKQAKAGRDWHS